MLNFMIIEVTWKLGYLWWLNFIQEDTLHVSMQNDYFFEDLLTSFSSKKMCYCQRKSKNHYFLSLQINTVCQEN